MQSNLDIISIELMCIIVDFNLGRKVMRILKKFGVTGGTIILGNGTVNNRILNLLAITDSRKEIVLAVTNKSNVDKALEGLNKEFKFEKKNHGIVFTTSICGVAGSSSFECSCKTNNEERGVDKTMYHVITVIVDKGKGEEVVSAGSEAGSKGGTIMNARGAGIHETSRLFHMEIEPEKEIVIILCENDKTEAIASAIREKVSIDKPGNGIIYIQNVNKTYGIYK